MEANKVAEAEEDDGGITMASEMGGPSASASADAQRRSLEWGLGGRSMPAHVGSVSRQMELGGSHGSGPPGSDMARHHHGDLMAPSMSGTGARKG
jgi:hypothetical protein